MPAADRRDRRDLGLWSDSRIVLFDGIYTVFGTALSGLSLLAAWASPFVPDMRYPFGRGPRSRWRSSSGAALTATSSTRRSIRSRPARGGQRRGTTSVIAYGVITLLVSLAVVVALAPRRARNWSRRRLPNGKRGCAERDHRRRRRGRGGDRAALGARELIAYADPVLVLIAVVVLAPVPWRLLRAGGREILEGPTAGGQRLRGGSR